MKTFNYLRVSVAMVCVLLIASCVQKSKLNNSMIYYGTTGYDRLNFKAWNVGKTINLIGKYNYEEGAGGGYINVSCYEYTKNIYQSTYAVKFSVLHVLSRDVAVKPEIKTYHNLTYQDGLLTNNDISLEAVSFDLVEEGKSEKYIGFILGDAFYRKSDE